LCQTGTYAIQEAAILFETGTYKNFDSVILVVAPKSLRIQRVVERDGTTTSQIQDRMNRQWEDERKVDLADYVVQNIEVDDTKAQVDVIHQSLLQEFQ
jgi:dephospho-CoA kinase